MLNEHRKNFAIHEISKAGWLVVRRRAALWKKFFARFGFFGLWKLGCVSVMSDQSKCWFSRKVSLIHSDFARSTGSHSRRKVPEISKTSCISCFNKFLMTLSFCPIMAWISARFSYQVRANEFVSQISPCARSQQQPRIPQALPKVFSPRQER